MKYLHQTFIYLFLFCASTAAAQDLSFVGAKAPWLTGFFAKMDPDTSEFSAVGTWEILNNNGQSQFTLPMDLSVSAGSLRWEIDTTKIQPLPQEIRTAAKMLHTDTVAFLIKSGQKKVYMIYPGIQAYVALPIPDSAFAEFNSQSDLIKLEKTELGTESVLGHPCVKTKVVLLEPNHPAQNGLLWCATDLQGFAVQMELHAEQNVMRFTFSKVQIEKPAAKLFEIPKTYVAFTNAADLVRYSKEKLQSSSENVP
jgi:hypothetical protein